jgi:hypothetical protein
MKTLARQPNVKETLAHTSTAVFTNTNFAFALSHGPVRDIRRAPRMILYALMKSDRTRIIAGVGSNLRCSVIWTVL